MDIQHHKNNVPSKYDILIKYYILTSVATYIPFYHISKTLIEGSILICIQYLISRRSQIKSSLPQLKTSVCAILVYALAFLIAFFMTGEEKDLKYFLGSLRIMLPVCLIYLAASVSDTIRLKHLGYAFSAGLILTFCLVITPWYDSGFAARITRGTNLLLIYGAAVAATIMMAIVLLREANNKTGKLVLLLALLTGLAALFASGAKGAILALVITLPLITLIYIRDKKFLITSSVLLAGILIVIFAQPSLRAKAQTALNQVSAYINNPNTNVRSSQGIRLDMWKNTAQSIWSEPFSIRGDSRLKEIFSDQINEGKFPKHIGRFPHVHNDYLQAWLARGPLGFFSLLALLLLPFITGLSKQTQAVAVSLAAVYALASMTNVPMLHSYSLRYYLLCMLLLLAIDKTSRQAPYHSSIDQ